MVTGGRSNCLLHYPHMAEILGVMFSIRTNLSYVLPSATFFVHVAVFIKCNHICIVCLFVFFLRVKIRHLRLSVFPSSHTSVFFLIDHMIHANAAKAAHAITDRRSFLMIELNRHESDTIANNPANTVSNKLPKKPMTFRKVLLTIDSISIYV